MTENMLLRGGVGRPAGQARTRLRCRTGESELARRDCARRPGGLREITAFLRISRSSYEYWRAWLSRPDSTLRGRVRSCSRSGGRNWGYRTIGRACAAGAARVRGRAPLMAGRGARRWFTTGRRRRVELYEGRAPAARRTWWPGSQAAPPTKLWVTDVTEFRVPAGKVYLSAGVDCYDGRPAGWRIGPGPRPRSPTGRCSTPSRPGGRGAHRGTATAGPLPVAGGMNAGSTGSRARVGRGCSPDNAACEGFFGRLKNESSNYRDWGGVPPWSSPERLTPTCGTIARGGSSVASGWLSLTSTAAARAGRRRKVRKNVRTPDARNTAEGKFLSVLLV